MSDSDDLAALLRQRRAEPHNRVAIDAAIDQRFGREQAVMFTDMVGFSRTVEAFGILHFLQLIQESETLFRPLIQSHGGRLVKQEGDSLLVLFDAPAAALACARSMVAATDQVNPGRSAEERIEVCMGLGYGRLLCIDTSDVWGAEVNAASKLGEELAKGSEILVTDRFFQAVGPSGFAAHGSIFGTRAAYRWMGN